MLISLGFLISGGAGLETESKVELLHADRKFSCALPDLPENHGRSRHTSNGGILCGGHSTASNDGPTTCLDISSGSWSSSNYQTLNEKYTDHSSWNYGIGKSFMLLGGGDLSVTTDIVHSDGTVDIGGFTLQDSTR